MSWLTSSSSSHGILWTMWFSSQSHMALPCFFQFLSLCVFREGTRKWKRQHTKSFQSQILAPLSNLTSFTHHVHLGQMLYLYEASTSFSLSNRGTIHRTCLIKSVLALSNLIKFKCFINRKSEVICLLAKPWAYLKKKWETIFFFILLKRQRGTGRKT